MMLSLCAALAFSTSPRRPWITARSPSDQSCQVCISFVSHLETEVFRAVDPEAISSDAFQLCRQLKAPLSSACAILIASELDSLKSNFLKGLDSRGSCETIGFCGTQTSPAKARRTSNLVAPF
jgi:hypothetical protein